MSDPFRFTTIGHAGRALLGPLSAESVDGLLAGIALQRRAMMRPRVLDVGCGKGEILLRAMKRFNAMGTGVEPNPAFASAVIERARELELSADLVLHELPVGEAPFLDTLLLTHGDPDHVGGALRVLSDFSPRRLWMGVPVPAHRPTTDVLDAAARLHVPVGARRAGDAFSLGEVRLRVLHPPEPDWERRRVRNDDSVVLEVVYRDVALLLTGDISGEVERTIAPRLIAAPTRILKVAHHGSRTSSSLELLSTWRPQIAIISAGRGNTFGHPATEVLRRLAAAGATVLRTDLDGQITLETDGIRVNVRTFRGE